MYPFTALRAPVHFTSLFFTYPVNSSLHFTLLFISTPSLPFTFYRLHFASLVFAFLTLVLKICVLAWELPTAPPGGWFQSHKGHSLLEEH